MVLANNLDHQITIDSCGMESWHIGKSPDARSIATAKSRGYDLSDLKARAVTLDDFDEFDYILAMDDGHYAALMRLAAQSSIIGAADKVHMYMACHDGKMDQTIRNVPDPYYDGQAAFEYALDLVEDGARCWLAHIHDTHLNA
jgi:protein-tyrosine phosphatase